MGRAADRILEGLNESLAIARGKKKPARVHRVAIAGDAAPIDARAIRARLALTQEEMAEMVGVPIGTWRNFEQRRKALSGPARALLRIMEREPEAAKRALRGAATPSASRR